ncbi:uncharacterized protein [Littorina saxatilis]|uniref:uncharacterized protein n=1 Tax=Littorina saxatilis TaxID=31220 RepID=UPI0038B6B113
MASNEPDIKHHFDIWHMAKGVGKKLEAASHKAGHVHRSLEGVIKSPYLLRDIGQLSPDVQTAHLEAYHSVINNFAPKMLHFTFPVMQAK